MIPEPPLGEEELAEMEAWALSQWRGDGRVPRLIAALRASRERSVELTAQADANARLAAHIGAAREEALAALRAKDEELRHVQELVSKLKQDRREVAAELAGLAQLAQSNRVEADAMGEIAREWESKVDALNEEIMGYQVRDGYYKGYEHGQAAAVAEILKTRAERDELRAAYDELLRHVRVSHACDVTLPSALEG